MPLDLGIDRTAKRLAGHAQDQVVGADLCHPVAGVDRRARDVRRDDGALLSVKGVIAQERFRDSFVHAHPVEVATPRVLQGEKFGGEEDLESFFLTEDDKQDIASRADALIEELTVRCARFDAKGKQVGAPVPVVLRRYRGGRWFIYEGLPL